MSDTNKIKYSQVIAASDVDKEAPKNKSKNEDNPNIEHHKSKCTKTSILAIIIIIILITIITNIFIW